MFGLLMIQGVCWNGIMTGHVTCGWRGTVQSQTLFHPTYTLDTAPLYLTHFVG
jgi:hypothetical protein